MSNGDDVLVDNWEEIDDAGLTNTLQKIKAERKTQVQQPANSNTINSAAAKSSLNVTQLASTLSSSESSTNASACLDTFTLSNIEFPTPGTPVPMKLLQRNASSTDSSRSGGGSQTANQTVILKSPLDNVVADFQPVMMMLHKPADEYQSTTYAQPTNLQTVKILRRPTQSSEPRNNGIKPRQPIKTLQQREQEYAEARLRILGAAKNPEDDVGTANAVANSSSTTSGNTVASPSSSSIPTTNASTAQIGNSYKSNNNAAKMSSGGSSGAGGGANNQNLYSNYYNQQQQQQQKQNYFFMQQQQPQSLPGFSNRTALASGISPLLPSPHTLQHQHQTPSSQATHQTWSPIVGGSVSSTALRQQQQESILRLPRGPDGSNGFQMRR